ncbi:NlpC/P60 family protein [Microbulbifer sp. SA54]|uniref:NlpC/P60 family protein n=1 Tax=Microbulbifer sp. SA54 TaxID=3401577 RepID=UPI003AAED503
MNKRLPSLLLAIATTTGCSLAPYQQAQKDTAIAVQEASPIPAVSPAPAPLTAGARHQQASTTSARAVRASLYRQHREWQGTRYQLGGMSKRGIDCSALVYLTYRDHLGIKLPRTTEYQALAGEAVKRGQLRAGDLVFFKTGRRDRHVGIYIEDGKFFHASTSKGVTISKMTDYYWKNRFWRARRLNLGSDA